MRLDQYLTGGDMTGEGYFFRQWCKTSSIKAVMENCCGATQVAKGAAARLEQLRNERYVGLEFEIENVASVDFPNSSASLAMLQYWMIKNDGSLRNNGREFVTYLGVTMSSLDKVLQSLNDYFHGCLIYSKLKASSRCSVHMHYGMWDYTIEELRSLVFVYMVLERAMFKVSGDRVDNIFCVPSEKITRRIWESLYSPSAKAMTNWKHLQQSNHSKYAALNLRPLWDQQTIEFRHHIGLKDPLKILPWATIIHELCSNSRIHTLKEWQEIVKDAWESNHLPDLVEMVSPTLLSKVGEFNLNTMLEPSVKNAFWASTDQRDIPEMKDDGDGSVTSRRKKPTDQTIEVSIDTVDGDF